jgi:hypothetical protein
MPRVPKDTAEQDRREESRLPLDYHFLDQLAALNDNLHFTFEPLSPLVGRLLFPPVPGIRRQRYMHCLKDTLSDLRE